MNRFKLKHLLIASIILAGLAPMLVVGFVSLAYIDTELHSQVFGQLESIQKIKKGQIEKYFSTIHKQVRQMSGNLSTVAAMHGFKGQFNQLPRRISKIDPYFRERVADYYRQDFNKAFERETGDSLDLDELIPESEHSLLAQFLYIASNPHPLGQKSELVDAGDGSGYSRLHANYHPMFKSFLEKYGYYDIFLVDPESGNVVYSVFKELDYGTSLKTGPYRGSNIALVFERALDLKDPEEVVIADFKQYLPSFNAAASFIASPIFDGSDRIGILIFQMPVGEINAIMQINDGMGESGESYLVAEDLLMRSQSRFSQGNSILHRRVDSETAKLALAGESGANRNQ